MSDGFDPFHPDEWRDTPGCGAFETALEMRARGALVPGAIPVLEAHLGACDTCREYAARLRRVEASLVAVVVAPDWGRLRQKMDAAFKETRRTPWLLVWVGLGVDALYSALSLLFTRRLPPLNVLLLSIPLVVAAGVIGTYVRRHRLRVLLAEPDVVAAYRRWVETSLKNVRRMSWFAPLYAALALFRALGTYHQYAEGDAAYGTFAVMNAFAFLAILWLMIWFRRQARRMRAELAELH